MEIIIGAFLAFCLLLLEKVLEMKDRLNNLEKDIKSIKHDINMVSKTMENKHKNEKQILKG